MLKIDMTPIRSFSYNQISNHYFQFLLLNEKYKAMHTPFQCKDYLQDMFWVEHTGNNQEVYGMEWEQGMLDPSEPFFNLAILGGKFTMKDRIPHLLKFLNTFEDSQGFVRSEIFETEDEHNIVIRFSKEWTQNGPLLSSFTTLIRLSGAYMSEDVVEYIKKVLENKLENPPAYMSPEISRMSSMYNKLLALLKGYKVNHAWENIESIMMAHHTGIVGFKEFPTAEFD